MKIAILIYDGFTALDAVGPYEVLSCLPGAKVHFVSTELGPKRAHTNFLRLWQITRWMISRILKSLWFRGERRERWSRPKIRAYSPGFEKRTKLSKWTTSVCTGSLILGAAGILKGLQATTHWYARDFLEKFGAQYLSKRVVRQGKIITAAGVSSGIDMALHLAKEVSGPEMAKTIQLLIEYDPKPPFDSGSIAKAEPSIVELANHAAQDAFK